MLLADITNFAARLRPCVIESGVTLQRETVITVLLIGACIVLTAINLLPRLLEQKAVVKTSQPDIMVSISGEVKKPGTYTLKWGSRIEDSILAAGGLTAKADANLINLAEPLDTGQSVFIPALMTEQGDVRISINNSSPKELESLPGVGPVTARLIIEGRPYHRLEDLLNVKGIGEKTLEKLRPFITLILARLK
jgi:competence protein ComEA